MNTFLYYSYSAYSYNQYMC